MVVAETGRVVKDGTGIPEEGDHRDLLETAVILGHVLFFRNDLLPEAFLGVQCQGIQIQLGRAEEPSLGSDALPFRLHAFLLPEVLPGAAVS